MLAAAAAQVQGAPHGNLSTHVTRKMPISGESGRRAGGWLHSGGLSL